jgi:hypothetical protein
MKKRILFLTLLILAILLGYTSAKAQRQYGMADRLRIQKVSESGIRFSDTSQGKPEVVGFSRTSALADSEPTCFVLLRDRVF